MGIRFCRRPKPTKFSVTFTQQVSLEFAERLRFPTAGDDYGISVDFGCDCGRGFGPHTLLSRTDEKATVRLRCYGCGDEVDVTFTSALRPADPEWVSG